MGAEKYTTDANYTQKAGNMTINTFYLLHAGPSFRSAMAAPLLWNTSVSRIRTHKLPFDTSPNEFALYNTADTEAHE